MSNTGVEYQLSLKDLFTPKINKAVSSTEKLNSIVSTTGRTLGSLGGALGVGLGVAGIVSFGKSVVDSLVNYEYFSASLRTLMKGDALASKALEGQLVSLAAKTPFSLNEIQDATKQLMAYGFAGGEVTKNIGMLGDVASALKIPFQDIAYLYGTLKTQGRAYQRDILQFQQRGIPVVAQLAKQFGVSKEKISEMVSAGKVGFPEVEKAFQSMTAEGGMFFNMMTEQSKTVGGQISNMGDNWEQLKVNIGKSQTGIIAGTVAFMNSMVSAMSGAFEQSNKMDEAIKNNGGAGFSFFDGGAESRAYNTLNAFDTYVAQSEKSLQKALDAKSRIHYAMSSIYKQFAGGKITQDELKNQIAIAKYTLNSVQGNVDLFGKKGEVAKPTGLESSPGSAGSKSSGTSSTTVEARGAQNFNISIDKLIEKLEFHTNNLKDSSSTIKSEVTKAMIGAVNDFQIMATK